MPFEVTPPVTDREAEALRTALAQAGIEIDSRPRLDRGAWRRAGAREAVGLEPVETPEDMASPVDSDGP